jgi:hypothetical protein
MFALADILPVIADTDKPQQTLKYATCALFFNWLGLLLLTATLIQIANL